MRILYFLILPFLIGCSTAQHRKHIAYLDKEVDYWSKSYIECIKMKTPNYFKSRERAGEVAVAVQGACSYNFNRYEKAMIENLSYKISSDNQIMALNNARIIADELKSTGTNYVIQAIVDQRSEKLPKN